MEHLAIKILVTTLMNLENIMPNEKPVIKELYIIPFT